MFGATVFGATPFGGVPDFEAAFEIEKPVGEKAIVQVGSLIGSELLKRFADRPSEIAQLGPREFEELVAELFRRFGYSVELTKRTRDGGVDVIAVAHREVKVKYLIECKHPKSGNPISVSAVRELYGIKTAEKATKAVLATTGRFTRDAQLFFEQNRWELEPRDFEGIKDWLVEYRASQPKVIQTGVDDQNAVAETDPFLQAIAKTSKSRTHWPKDYALNHGHYISGEPKKS